MVPLLLEGAAGCENVNCNPPVGAPVDVDTSGCGAAGKVAGWEKLKPEVAGLELENKPEAVDVVAAPKGELDNVVVVGSGLTLIIGLNRASLDGLKLNSDEPNPLLCVTLDVEVPNMLVVAAVEVGCPNTGCPNPTPELAAAGCPN